jgi:hypothetical protein
MSDSSNKLHWDELLGQLSCLSTQFGQIPPESGYYKLGQDFQESLRLLLIDGFKEASPLNRFSTPKNQQNPAEEATQPEAPVKKKKERYKPIAKPYFSEQEEPERMEQLFTQLYAQCSRCGDKKHLYANGGPEAPSDFLGCLFIACMNILKNDERFNLRAFFNLFNKIRSQLGKDCPVIVTYDAVRKKLEVKKKLRDWVEDYDKSTVRKFYNERVKAGKNKEKLVSWSEIYERVLEDGRTVGLFPPAKTSKK